MKKMIAMLCMAALCAGAAEVEKFSLKYLKSSRASKLQAKEMTSVKGVIPFEKQLVFSLKYPEMPVGTWHRFSFKIKKDEMLALVGPTGVGKTTITELLSRFYEPDSGRILIDGHDIKDITIRSLRQNISTVLQDTFLFNGTIAENISYARPEATMEEIKEAARAANIDQEIEAMPEGYDTVTGERGVKLSGGQKQRIAIARAILRRSPIIVLDEATAAVDVETEKQIRQAINSLTGQRTIIAIAHRLSTIRTAEQILVIEDGTVVERGTHEKLLELNGPYAHMNEIQKENE